MKRLILISILISSSIQAQFDFENFEFLEGKYSNQPFTYPSVLSLKEVRNIVDEIESLTNNEISYISYLPIEGVPSFQNKINIFMCQQGTRFTGLCDGGEMYIYELISDKWTKKPEKGIWVE